MFRSVFDYKEHGKILYCVSDDFNNFILSKKNNAFVIRENILNGQYLYILQNFDGLDKIMIADGLYIPSRFGVAALPTVYYKTMSEEEFEKVMTIRRYFVKAQSFSEILTKPSKLKGVIMIYSGESGLEIRMSDGMVYRSGLFMDKFSYEILLDKKEIPPFFISEYGLMVIRNHNKILYANKNIFK